MQYQHLSAEEQEQTMVDQLKSLERRHLEMSLQPSTEQLKKVMHDLEAHIETLKQRYRQTKAGA